MFAAEEEKREFAVWNKYYAEAVDGKGDEAPKPQSLWWRNVNEEIFAIVGEVLRAFPAPRILEAGCGAGKSSLDLAERIPGARVSLMDISAHALAFARMQSVKRNLSGVTFTEGSIFDMPYPDGSFDMVWNVGLVEHYTRENMRRIVREMHRVLGPRGRLVIGIPNRASLAVLKAALLGSRFGRTVLPFVPGYRNETEILYSNAELARLIAEETGAPITLRFAGSLLWVGAPEGMVRLFDRCFKGSRFSFISLLISEKPG